MHLDGWTVGSVSISAINWLPVKRQSKRDYSRALHLTAYLPGTFRLQASRRKMSFKLLMENRERGRLTSALAAAAAAPTAAVVAGIVMVVGVVV